MKNTTFKPFRGRTVEPGEIVKVYRNLHRKGAGGAPVYSIKSATSGLILGHAEEVELHRAHFSVSEAGRQRVLREKQKNVHAYVIGAYNGAGEPRRHEAYYNPYRTASFVTRNVSGDLMDALQAAAVVHLGSRGMTYTGKEA